jgi:hypothetical protein
MMMWIELIDFGLWGCMNALVPVCEIISNSIESCTEYASVYYKVFKKT